MGVQSLSAVVRGPLQGLRGVLPHVDTNKSVTRRDSSPALCREQIVVFGEGWGGRSDLPERSIYHRDKTLPILSADRQEPSAKHIQEMHILNIFFESIHLFASDVKTSV